MTMIIEELEITGKDKTPAKVVFKKGLNIISGASDTGKSYIFECLYFMLGGSDQSAPKNIPEAKGYSSVRLRLSFSNGTKLDVERALEGGDFRLSRPNGKFSKEDIGNVDFGRKLLAELGVNEIKLRSNASNEKKNLTISHLKHFTMIDEGRIVAKTSPISSEQYTEKTLYESCFAYLLSGSDDSALIKAPDKKLVAARYEGGSGVIEDLITKVKERIGDTTKKELEVQVENLNIQIEKHISQIEETNTSINSLTRKNLSYKEKIQALKVKKNNLSELNVRFELLSSSYSSDLGRLSFLEEGNHLFAQLRPTTCPVCGQSFSTSHSHAKPASFEEINKAMEAERVKLTVLSDDLKLAQSDLAAKLSDLSKESMDLVEKVLSTEVEINAHLSIDLKLKREKIQELLDTKQNVLERLSDFEELERYLKIKEEIEQHKPTKAKKEKKAESSKLDAYIYEFNNFIETVLKAWNFSASPKVEFNNKENEFVIDGKLRSSYGKGFRAILYSAFSVALLEYCQDKQKPHLGLLVLDSPLTTHKEKDTMVQPGDEDVAVGMQESFFDDLLKRFKNGQIILLDNKSPPASIVGKINYIHYSKVKGQDDYGFFPVA